MNLTLPTTPAERFAAIIEGVCRAIGTHAAKERLLAPVLRLVWSRLRRIGARFARLAARIPAGAPPRPHRTLALARRATPPASRPPHRWAGLPRRPGWLLRFLPPMVYPAKSQLEYLLADPEMAALLAASPGLRRSLRPLCRMLGLPVPVGPRHRAADRGPESRRQESAGGAAEMSRVDVIENVQGFGETFRSDVARGQPKRRNPAPSSACLPRQRLQGGVTVRPEGSVHGVGNDERTNETAGNIVTQPVGPGEPPPPPRRQGKDLPPEPDPL
ncbi:MAG: hypothetical protein ACP5NI_04125 [Acetobacteraceae bacterium]